MRALPLVALFVTVAALPLAAQTAPTTAPSTTPATPPAATTATTPTPAPAPQTSGPKMTMAQATAWKDKPVYSSDAKKIGEVRSFSRAADDSVLELLADIGGFMGIGESHVRVTPTQFDLQADRVVLKMTADQAKTLPKVQK
jgi:hypothetical protein